MDGRIWDRGALLILALVCAVGLAAVTIGSCDARERRREATEAKAEARAQSIARAMAASIDDSTREQARQHLAVEALEQRAAFQQARVDDYKDVTLYGLAVLGALVAVVGILFPVSVYLTSIRPGEKVVEEARRLMKEGLDARFAELVERQRNDRVAAAMGKLRSDGPTDRQAGALYFTLNQHDPLTPQQLFELAEIFIDSDAALQNQLAPALILRDSPYVDPALIAMFSKTSNVSLALNYSLQHCRFQGATKLRAHIKAWALAKEGLQFVPTIFSWGPSVAPEFVRELINDQEWLARLPRMTQFQIGLNLNASTLAHSADLQLENSVLTRMLKGTIYTPVTAALQDCAVAEAQAILEHHDGVVKRRLERGTPEFAELSKTLSSGASSP